MSTSSPSDDAHAALAVLATTTRTSGGWGVTAAEIHLLPSPGGTARTASGALMAALVRRGWAEDSDPGSNVRTYRVTAAGLEEQHTVVAARRAASGTVTVPRWAVEAILYEVNEEWCDARDVLVAAVARPR